MSYVIAIVISFLLAAIIGLFWIRGIDFMKKNHPKYDGDDFLDWENAEAPWVEDWHPHETL
jgi:hypothetical protein